MIESSFLSSSPWDSDPFQDLELIPDVSSFDIEELSCELDNESFKLSGSSTPVDICSSSSDYDCLLLDKILPVSDIFVSQILGDDENISGFSDLDWLALSDSPKQYNQNDASSSDGRAFKSDPFEWLLAAKAKLWSKMTPADQLNTLHALSDIVTYHMGISEQIQIIKVIDPKAVILPEDKEFALDSTNLTDAKLRKIKDLIKKHRHKCLTSESPTSHRSFSSLESTKSSTKLMSRKKTNINYFRSKRKQKKGQKVIKESHVYENQKLLKQNKKELKSGFFVHEMKMKLINPEHTENEDEDVNILE